MALGAAVIFIYIVLASQFGSFLQPLAHHGVAAAGADRRDARAARHALDDQPVLDDRPGDADGPGDEERDPARRLRHHGRRAGLSVPEALLQAGLVRMRPIIMTTMAMIFGMLPLALALNEGGEIQAPMGRAIIGGVITSTLLTLVVVPVLYSYLVRDRKPREAAEPAPAPPLASGGAGTFMPAAKE
jgi:hypothetical protein